MTLILEFLEFSVVFRGSGLEGNGINRTVLEMGKLYSFSTRALAIAVFRQTDAAF